MAGRLGDYRHCRWHRSVIHLRNRSPLPCTAGRSEARPQVRLCQRREGGAACAGRPRVGGAPPALAFLWAGLCAGGRGRLRRPLPLPLPRPWPKEVSPLRCSAFPAHPSPAPVSGRGSSPLPAFPGGRWRIPRPPQGSGRGAAPRLGARGRGRAGRRRGSGALPSPPYPTRPSLTVLAAAPPPACDPLPHVSGEEGRRRAGPSVAAATTGGGGGAAAGVAARRPPAASSLGPAGAPSPPAPPMPVWCCRCSLAGHFR